LSEEKYIFLVCLHKLSSTWSLNILTSAGMGQVYLQRFPAISGYHL